MGASYGARVPIRRNTALLGAALASSSAMLQLQAAVGSITLVLVLRVAIRPPLPRAPGTIGLILLAGVLDAGANALYALATVEGLLSVVSVLGSLYPAVTVVLARLVLAERIAWWQQAGVGATLAGVGLIAAG